MSYTVTGLFYVNGGLDYPLTYNYRNLYGFDKGSTVPIFKYSISDIVDFLGDNLRTISIYDGDNKFNTIMGFDSLNYLKSIDDGEIPNSDFSKLMTAIRGIHDLQNTANRLPNNGITDKTDPDYYVNVADEYLNTNFQGKYVNHSANPITSPLHPGRLSHITFTFKLDGVNKDFIIYYNPDDMMINIGLDTAKVVDYANYDEDKAVDGVQFGETLLTGLLNLEKESYYRNVFRFETVYVVTDKDNKEIDRYPIYFNIFNHMYIGYQIPGGKAASLVKTYLIDKFNRDYDYLSIHYPELFAGLVVNLYPLFNNTYMNNVVVPISLASVRNEFTIRGIPEDIRGKCDMFILEGITKYDEDGGLRNSTIRIPFIATEENSISPESPIGDTYIDYRILHTNSMVDGGNWETLSNLIKVTYEIVSDMIVVDDPTTLSKYIVGPYTMDIKSKQNVSSNIKYYEWIEFTYRSIRYRVNNYIRVG